MLQSEVLALRGEVAQLKLQLLAHKDCPVTLTMCNQPATDVNSKEQNCHLKYFLLIFFLYGDGLLLQNSSNPARNMVTIGPPAPACQTQPRQIIFLNSGNSLPIVNKPISPSVVMNQPPLVVLPGSIPELNKELTPNLALIGASQRVDVPQGQETSVIISLRSNEK